MQFGDMIVRTPFYEYGDDPTWYDPMWRHRGSLASVEYTAMKGLKKEEGIPERLKDDKFFRKAYDYNWAWKVDKAGLSTLKSDEFKDYHNAMEWSLCTDGNPARYRVDPLLLCPSELDRIIRLLMIPPAMIETYESCFFNVRKNRDTPITKLASLAIGKGGAVRITDGSPVDLQWRAKGLVTEAELLLILFGTWVDMEDLPPPPKVDRMLLRVAQHQAFQDVIHNNVPMETLSILIANGNASEQQRAMTEQEKARGSSNLVVFMMDWMQNWAPTLYVQKQLEDAMRDQSKQIQSKLALEHRIKSTNILDKGPMHGHTGLTDFVKGSIDVVPLPPNTVIPGA